jgi:MarR family transcriptional regulator, organic hydroperoxide resistance regulator
MPPQPKPANGLAPSPPTHERVTFLIHRVNAKIAQVANPLFRVHQLDLVSSRIVVLLLEHREMRVGELVDRMVLPQSTISHQVLKLEKRGLIRRRRAADDNRSTSVSLTRRGEEVARECNQLSLAVYRHIVDGLSDAEADLLRGLLGKMFATLDSFPAEPRRGSPKRGGG